MKQIAVISGKGGTGKTMLSSSFAALAPNALMVDCDVDAADLHLLLHPQIRQRNEFRSGQTARIDRSLCRQCDRCRTACYFRAISPDFSIDPIACEGCGLCRRLCPYGAIVLHDSVAGEWFISDTQYGPMVHAALGIAEENSGKLVAKIRETAISLAQAGNRDYVLIDGPPGVGCPVMATLTGIDLAVVVTEPTLSGIHDMRRVCEITRHFGVRTVVVINKSDLHAEYCRQVRQVCGQLDVEVIGLIPFSEQVGASILRLQPLVEYDRGPLREYIVAIWDAVRVRVDHESG